MLKISYLLKAAMLLPSLEMKLQTKHSLSNKMGIMVDADKVHCLPSNRIPVRLNGVNEEVFKHKGFKIYTYRNDEEPVGLIAGVDCFECGNEIENGAVIEKPYSVDEYIKRQLCWSGPSPRSNPGLVSINQNVGYWRELLAKGIENAVDYLSIHLYIQSRKMDRIDNTWVDKKWYRKLSDKWEYIKAIAALMEFRDKTTKPIIITECGVCQLTAEVPEDVQWMDLILTEVLGSRLKAACWYNLAELTEYPGHAILAYL
jgi:hypothetical protein